MIYLIPFLSGAVMMALELVIARLVTPYYGGSLIEWGSVIGVVLLLMAAGMYLGGKVPDQKRPITILIILNIFSSLFVFSMPLWSNKLLAALWHLGPVWGCIWSVAVLLALPIIVLSLSTPALVGIYKSKFPAKFVGYLGAASNLGCILGTFGATFLLIPWTGLIKSLLLLASLELLLALCLAILTRSERLKTVILFMAIFYLNGMLYITEGFRLPTIFYTQSPYNSIEVTEQDGVRSLFLNHRFGVQSEYALNGQTVVPQYIQDFLAVSQSVQNPQKILVLGVAGGQLIKIYHQLYPNAQITGVELDPKVLQVSQKFFDLKPSQNVQLVVDDARSFLIKNSQQHYDIIALDAFRGIIIPSHLLTKEFFTLASARLNDHGVMLLNFCNGPVVNSKLEQAIEQTLVQVFSQVALKESDGNEVLAMSHSPMSLNQHFAKIDAKPKPRILTDDRNPSDVLNIKIVRAVIQQAASLEHPVQN